MYHNGQTYIWVPTKLTFARLTVETAAIINDVHATIGKPSLNAGDLNPYYFDLNDIDMGGAPFTRDVVPGKAVCGPIKNISYLGLFYVGLIVLLGGDVEGLPVWFEINDLNASVPEPWKALDPERTTWATWGTWENSHLPKKIGNKWYRDNSVGRSGQKLDATQFIGLGLTILTDDEYHAIQPVMVP